MKLLKNNRKIKAYFVSLIALVLLLPFSCRANAVVKKPIQSNPMPEHRDKKPEQIIPPGECDGFNGAYDFDRFDNQSDNATRLHELKCAYNRDGASALKSIVSPGANKKTLLYSALEKQDLDSVHYLLDTIKVDINAQINGKDTVLINAIKNDKLEIVKTLISLGADVNTPNTAGDTPLISAIVSSSSQNNDIVNALLAVPKIDVNKQDGVGYTLLMRAILANNTDLVNTLLGVPGIDLNKQDSGGKTALMLILANSSLIPTFLQPLISATPTIPLDANLKDNTEGNTALMIVVKLLVVDPNLLSSILSIPGIDLNITNNAGNTALMVAAATSNSSRNSTTITALVAAGADVIVQNNGKTACDIAPGYAQAMHDCT